jgi:hypothetical protein
MIKSFILGMAVIASYSANATDLFEKAKPANFSRRDPVTSSTTIGGYPIYKGDERWIYFSGEVQESGGRADSIPLGTATMLHVEDNRLIAAQSITANLSNNTNAAYWSGSPCAGTHLLTLNKGVGRNDSCLTIDPLAIDIDGVKNIFIAFKIMSSTSSGRIYKVDFMLNVAFLGFDKTTITDWTPTATASDPAKSQLMTRLGAWSEKYLDATKNVLDYSRPADTFDKVPNFKSLAPL